MVSSYRANCILSSKLVEEMEDRGGYKNNLKTLIIGFKTRAKTQNILYASPLPHTAFKRMPIYLGVLFEDRHTSSSFCFDLEELR